MHGVGEKVAPPTVRRELSREVFRGEAVDFCRWARSFSTNVFRTACSDTDQQGAEIETGWRSCQGKANFFRPGPARNYAQHSWRSWARLLTSGVRVVRLKRRSLFPAARRQGSERVDDRGSLEELHSESQATRTFVIR